MPAFFYKEMRKKFTFSMFMISIGLQSRKNLEYRSTIEKNIVEV